MQYEKQFPGSIDFWPKSYTLPGQALNLELDMRSNPNTIFIVKLATVDRGEGISLMLGKNFAKVNKEEAALAQRYIASPFLLDGHKFDMRIYVVVLSVSPLEVYYYREGMVRLASKIYQEPDVNNIKDKSTHLTNYS